MAIGVVLAFFVLPKTKGFPLEELAAIFGDDDEIVVYMKDIHVDHTTHQLVINHQKGTAGIGQVVTELHGRPRPAVKRSREVLSSNSRRMYPLYQKASDVSCKDDTEDKWTGSIEPEADLLFKIFLT